ncbi:hypothetical protein L1049_023376 [Liquidambar formosana]|uniref:1,3-beta-glucan synthase component FKS1-like domain-containing protein n=1 Tax=Liquidambar formosana TaxID=63359 RepID=A0AAP0RZ22_LIQFO
MTQILRMIRMVMIHNSYSFYTLDFIFLFGVKLPIFDLCPNAFAVFFIWNVHPLSSGTNQRPRSRSFLDEMITPIYEVIHKEAERNKKGEPSHSTWRNYDDLNEYFWTKQCSELNWLDCCADFKGAGDATPNELTAGSCKPKTYFNAQCWKPKTNFVEVRTFWHLFRSFNRMWIFFILAFQEPTEKPIDALFLCNQVTHPDANLHFRATRFTLHASLEQTPSEKSIVEDLQLQAADGVNL